MKQRRMEGEEHNLMSLGIHIWQIKLSSIIPINQDSGYFWRDGEGPRMGLST